MNPYTGEVRELTTEQLSEWEGELGHKVKELTSEEYEKVKDEPRWKRKGWMRNKPCICGSGSKFKKCCGRAAI